MRFYAELLLYLECLKPDVSSTLGPCPRCTEVVTFVPEGSSNKERWLLPDFEVFGTMAPIVILSVLSGSPGLETERSGCNREVPSGGPFRSLGQPDIDPS